jgi:hypothetical protein
MSKFRKKPVVIDAFQWKTDPAQTQWAEIPAWVAQAIYDGTIIFEHGPALEGNVRMIIRTLEDGHYWKAEHVASPGDWIIRGVKGEFYPCKPDIFAATYEALEKTSQQMESWVEQSMIETR